MFVYCFTNTVNGKRYVGITDRTLEDRWYKHLTSVRNGSEYHFRRAICKHGEQAFEGLIIEECTSPEELKEAERRWIWLLASNVPERGYNMTLGGDGIFGHKMTEESRQRMRESHLGKKHTPEQREKIRAAMLRRYADPAERQRTREALMGHQVSDETRRKMSENRRGIPVSEETRKKISQANTGRIMSAETRRKMSVAARKRWLNKEKNEGTISMPA